MERLLSTITSLAFSEIVVSLAPWGIHRVGPLEPALRELYRTKEFTVTFCLEISNWTGLEEDRLILGMKKTFGTGLYDFLPCPPLVFSRAVVSYHLHWTWQ